MPPWKRKAPVAVSANRKQQLIDEYVAVRSERDLRVIAKEPSDGIDAPPVPISSLLAFNPFARANGRRKIRGVLTAIRPGVAVLQNGATGIEIKSAGPFELPVNTAVEAIGFPALGPYSPVLEDARIRPSAATLSADAPPLVSVEKAANGDYDMQLVTVQGEITARVGDRERQVLWLRSENESFAAVLEGAKIANALDSLAEGSVVQVTAVCQTRVSPGTKEPVGFRLWLRSAKDVRVVKSPPWWTGTMLLESFAATLGIALAIFGWNMILRRRVRLQTMEIQQQAAFERQCNAILERVGRNEEIGVILGELKELAERHLDGKTCCIRAVAISPSEFKGNGLPPHFEPGTWCRCGRESIWSAPVSSASGELLSVVRVHSTPDRGMTDKQLHFLKIVVRISGFAIEHSQYYHRLTRLSQQDILTGAANRGMFEDRLDEAIAHGDRHAQRVALIYIDLDGFKQINDTLGHRAGDEVLRVVAERLASSVRDSDTVARIGGDEFCVIVPNLKGKAQAEVLANKLLARLNAPVTFETEEIYIGASIGVSLFPDHGRDSAGLQRNADSAMYRAKRAGKSCVRMFDGTRAPHVTQLRSPDPDLALTC